MFNRSPPPRSAPAASGADTQVEAAAPSRRTYRLHKGKPGAGFMLAHPAHAIALGFGSGLSPLAPGTAGTLWAWLAWLLLQSYLTTAQLGWLILGSTLIGWWACTVTAKNLQVLDPGSIVWDEVVAFWLVLWLIMPTGFGGQLVAFLLFRFFDAIKPGPVAWADQHFKGFNARGGFGILFDDTLAAFCTLLVIAAWKFW
jgi:phosphatidylglycerophosphatase A